MAYERGLDPGAHVPARCNRQCLERSTLCLPLSSPPLQLPWSLTYTLNYGDTVS